MSAAPVELETPGSVPDEVAAASLGLAILGMAKCSSWTELGRDLPAGLRLTDHQRGLLEAHSRLLSLLRVGRPSVSIEVCETCGRWIASASGAGTANHSCRATLGCPGPTHRAARRARAARPGGAERQLRLFEDPAAGEAAPDVGA